MSQQGKRSSSRTHSTHPFVHLLREGRGKHFKRQLDHSEGEQGDLHSGLLEHLRKGAEPGERGPSGLGGSRKQVTGTETTVVSSPCSKAMTEGQLQGLEESGGTTQLPRKTTSSAEGRKPHTSQTFNTTEKQRRRQPSDLLRVKEIPAELPAPHAAASRWVRSKERQLRRLGKARGQGRLGEVNKIVPGKERESAAQCQKNGHGSGSDGALHWTRGGGVAARSSRAPGKRQLRRQEAMPLETLQ